MNFRTNNGQTLAERKTNYKWKRR